MKTKIKQLVCMVLAFVTSFTATVTAFADGVFIDYPNENYLGYYFEVSNEDAYVKTDKTHGFIFYAYCEDNVYYNGKSSDGAITSRDYAVTFNSIGICNKQGELNGTTAYNKTFSGKTSPKMGGFLNLTVKSVTLSPNGQSERYVHNT